jgi:hypothetical protein
MDDPGQVGEQQGEHRSGDQLGDAPSTPGLAVDGSLVEALHEVDGGVDQDRAEQTGHEPGVEVAQIGIDPHDDVASGRVQRLPQRAALAVPPPVLGEHLGGHHHPGAGGRRHFLGAIGGVVVDHHDLVDEAQALDEPAADGGDDRADGRLLVAGGEAHRHRGRALHRDQRVDGEVIGVVGTYVRRDHVPMVPGRSSGGKVGVVNSL